jgi:hypothetical protein
VFVALIIQYGKRMRHIILLSVACLSLPHVSTLSYKRRGYGKKVIEHEICALSFSTIFSKICLILRGTERHIIRNVHMCSCKVRFQWILYVCDRFSKNPQISNFMKIRPVGVELFRAADRQTDRQTDRHDEANRRFSQFCEKRLKFVAEVWSRNIINMY